MVNILAYFRKNNTNAYSLVISLLLAIWYNGIAGLINYYFPERPPYVSLLLMIIPLLLFLSDDGSLNELYNPIQTTNLNHIANITQNAEIEQANRQTTPIMASKN
jgi:hypothetical protein